MYAQVKKAAVVLALASIATIVMVACAVAQIGPTNPSGGTSLRLATEEGRGTFSTVGITSRQLALPVSWQSLFGGFLASPYTSSFVIRWIDVKPTPAVTRRSVAKR